MRIENQRRVVAALADRLPRDPGFAMARPHPVRGRKTVNSHDIHAALGQLIKDRAAHGAETDDDEIGLLGHGRRPRSIGGHEFELTKSGKFDNIFVSSEAKSMI